MGEGLFLQDRVLAGPQKAQALQIIILIDFRKVDLKVQDTHHHYVNLNSREKLNNFLLTNLP